MIGSHELKNRDGYLKKLIGFQDTEPVKVVTGIRRCGKSSLLKLMIRHLRETGVQAEQIVKMNFESHDFKSMTSDEYCQDGFSNETVNTLRTSRIDRDFRAKMA